LLFLYRMKFKYLSLIALLSVIIIGSCSKSSINKNPISVTKPINTIPLPNTVDKTDTIKVMAYNVLNYGDGCQGSTSVLDAYLKTIVQYAQPDLLSCEKMTAFPTNSVYPINLAADITNNALNAAFPNRYAYATLSDTSFDSKMSVLFYNKQKLTFVNMHTIVVNVSDFDLYKLYYNDPNIAITHDTTYLYVLVNHTQSGSSSATRDQQVTKEMQVLRSKFTYFPNLINMGDFNTSSSQEAGYQAIITSPDTATKMSDPGFFPDKVLKYPAYWDNNASPYSSYLTTSTRASISIPNSCGTGGGANSWYDHIFISPWLVNGSNYVTYVRNSYQTIGNDGNRLAKDINSISPLNTSAPAAVIDALFQFSNKYPVSIKLLVKANRTGGSIADPAERN
jgi:hypothetical protein